ncbi:hypothetical protein [Vannielia litorea]|uniref:hypothetical protein n=1 Tax=Vannielia litorea TaxID=1217970 RepID=UPI001BCB566B|nr:hypothetical protein [Vannielia litorea]MBS8227107.1 hypothetical protein [Vannielia litorea]
MTVELVEGPWKVAGIEALHFRVARDGVHFLCRITDLALFDDYREPYEGNTMETLFEKHLEDILRRIAVLLPQDPIAEEGEPVVTVRSGMAMP